ncbi:hypothetical protein GQN54_02245 [Cryomorphaceae bacterium S-15]|jgi:hypothetical protein|uniref:Uncharacterized protein n=2 Tax=Acidiluteibacter ferrifornacis TaxID=2692424 RepID=A0A6N9NI79_9FLAO|nr:hypothetical protein [bacterium]NBG64920.1 hypothetical protein [Acidiluteibacter ferrifornacis]
MDMEFEKKWKEVVEIVEKRFGEGVDMQSLLFLIGVQELGHGPKKFTKDQKLDVIHVAVCTLLSRFGYYEFEGIDKDEWPHWKATNKLPYLKSSQQTQLMKQAIVEYFEENKLAR